MSFWENSLLAEAAESIDAASREQRAVQETVYENYDQVANDGRAAPDFRDSRHSTEDSPAAIAAAMDAYVSRMAGHKNEAAKAISGLEFIAQRMTWLTDLEGVFIGEISPILSNCGKYFRAIVKRDCREFQGDIYGAGAFFTGYQRDFPNSLLLANSKFSLYAPGMQLEDPRVVYPPHWPEKPLQIGINGTPFNHHHHAKRMLGYLCKIISSKNIVLYISTDAPSRYAPWKVNGSFSKKLLAKQSIASFPTTNETLQKGAQPLLPPVIQKLVPLEGTMNGGTEITLLGSGFYEGLEVMFGDIQATTTTLWGDKCLTCITPAASKAGFVTIRLTDMHHQDLSEHQGSDSISSIYHYIDHRDAGNYGIATQAPANRVQSLGVDKKSESRQYSAARAGIIMSLTPASGISSVALSNLAIVEYLAKCLMSPDVIPVKDARISEQVGISLTCLNRALAILPLEDDSVFSAILLWAISKTWNEQRTANSHWDGIKQLLKVRPDFEIRRPLAMILFFASLAFTNEQHKAMTKVGEVIAAVFISAKENNMDTDDDAQSVVTTAAPTPAATVYSPWSETDVDPPPYMLSPTPLRQACAIYAAVNARR
jgi:hypothetical protein